MFLFSTQKHLKGQLKLFFFRIDSKMQSEAFLNQKPF